MTPLLLEHRNGSLYAVVDSITPFGNQGELEAVAAQIGRQVPVFGLDDTVPTQSSVMGGHLRMFMQHAFKHDPRNMIALRVFLQWRGDFSPHIEHDSYVNAKFTHLVYTEQVRLLKVQVEPDVTVGHLVDYVRNQGVSDLMSFVTEDECAALELAGLAVPVAGNAADAAAAACYAFKGEVVNALVSTAMIFVPGFLQAGIVAVRRGRAFQAARALAKARLLKRAQLLEAYRAAGRRGLETMRDQLAKLDQVGRGLPIGTLPGRGTRVGEGNFSDVFLSTDGTMVVKQIKPWIGRPSSPMAISRAEQSAIATRTVEQHDILRAQGYPVPKSWVPANDPTVIVQQRAPGVPLKDLPADVAAEARGAASGLKNNARRAHGVEIDVNADDIAGNMVFDEFGNVTAWYDPGIPLDSDATRAISNRAWGANAL